MSQGIATGTKATPFMGRRAHVHHKRTCHLDEASIFDAVPGIAYLCPSRCTIIIIMIHFVYSYYVFLRWVGERGEDRDRQTDRQTERERERAGGEVLASREGMHTIGRVY